MSRLVLPEHEKRKPRVNTHLNARLSDEQNRTSDEQSKKARRKIVTGILLRSAQSKVTRNGLPIWRGVLP